MLIALSAFEPGWLKSVIIHEFIHAGGQPPIPSRISHDLYWYELPAEGLLFATQRTDAGNYVLWTQRNPLGITETGKATYDALGNYIPFRQMADPRPAPGSFSSASMGGLSGTLANPDAYGMGCLVDGTPTNCNLAMRMRNNGSAAQCRNNDCGPQALRVHTQEGSSFSFLTTPFMAFARTITYGSGYDGGGNFVFESSQFYSYSASYIVRSTVLGEVTVPGVLSKSYDYGADGWR
jgi:hypothetical protein